MRPRPSSNTDPQGDLFKVELDTLVDPGHPLVRLAGQDRLGLFERQLGDGFCETNGAPAKPVRLMVGRHYLKHHAERLKMPSHAAPLEEKSRGGLPAHKTHCMIMRHFPGVISFGHHDA